MGTKPLRLFATLNAVTCLRVSDSRSFLFDVLLVQNSFRLCFVLVNFLEDPN